MSESTKLSRRTLLRGLGVIATGAGAVAVVEAAGAPDGAEAGQLRWFVGAETLNQCADAQSLYQNLSCSTGVVLRELLDKHGEEAAEARRPSVEEDMKKPPKLSAILKGARGLGAFKKKA